jgi:AcrR family transcriptional regulator
MLTVSTLTATKPAYHHGDLRTALVDAGLAILAEGGDSAALTLREAARRAGVSAMAPYRHFADKDTLLAAIAAIGFERLAEAQREADAAPSPAAAMKAQGVAYIAFALDNPALFRLMFGAAQPSMGHEALASAAKSSFDLLVSRVLSIDPPSGMPGGEMDRVLAHWSLVHGLAMLAVDGQLDKFGAPPIELADRVASLTLRPAGA